MKKTLISLFVVLSLFSLGASAAEDPESEKKPAPESSAKDQEKPKEQISKTSHVITINGSAIRYTATAGNMIVKEEDGTPKASFFFVAYTKEGADPSTRPVTFTFNGGPGSSSVWLHIGAFGPKRVTYADADGAAPAPPYHLMDNEDSILDATDLVFIDPITTGYSRAIPPKEDKPYHGIDGDIRSVGDFIRLYTTRYERWASPKFLAGESYGTTRAAGLSGYLQQNGVYLNGIVLISSILNFQTAEFGTGNDQPYVFFLPTYAATAWYHHRLAPALQSKPLKEIVDSAEAFAIGEYASALMKSDQLSAPQQRAIAERVASFTGLSPEYVQRANLRIEISRFTKELLRDQRRTIGRLDSRFKGTDLDAAGEAPEFDPSYASILGNYTAMLNDYVRRELKYQTDLPYEILTGRVYPWSYDEARNSYVDVAETLRSAMNQNTHLKVFVANGYFDMATPFAATKYTFDRLNLDPALRGNVSMDFFEAGHMMYVHRPSHDRLSKDVREFIRTATSP